MSVEVPYTTSPLQMRLESDLNASKENSLHHVPLTFVLLR